MTEDLPNLHVDPAPVINKLLENYTYVHPLKDGRLIETTQAEEDPDWRRTPINRTGTMELLRRGNCVNLAHYLNKHIPGIRMLVRWKLSSEGRDVWGIHVYPVYKYRNKVYYVRNFKVDKDHKRISMPFWNLKHFMRWQFWNDKHKPLLTAYAFIDKIPDSIKTEGDLFRYAFKDGPIEVVRRKTVSNNRL